MRKAVAVLLVVLLGSVEGRASVTLPEELRVEVTGSPAPVVTVRTALVEAARTQLPGFGLGEVALASVWPPLAPLPPGSADRRGAVFQVRGPGRFPTSYGVPARIANVALPWADARALLVSNSPERVLAGGTLYRASVFDGQVVRLVYHHQNGSPARPMNLTVLLRNPGGTPLTLWASVGQGGPAPDELGAGHQAALRFLEQYWHHAGVLMRLSGHAAVALDTERLSPGDVASGVAQIALVKGDRVDLRVRASVEGEEGAPTPRAEAGGRAVPMPEVAAPPEVRRLLSYVAGGPAAFMVVGGSEDEASSGIYGVVYTFVVRMANPLPAPEEAALVMHAEGGPARGTFRIGNEIVETPVVVPNRPQVLATVRLPPGASRELVVSTMPESGSNYPVLLVLGPP
jgi:hypothetical protein